MTDKSVAQRVIEATPARVSPAIRTVGSVAAVLAVVGLVLGFALADNPATGWVALLTATVLSLGLAVGGVLISAIFEMTGAKWGLPYRRLAESSVALMPVSVVGLVILVAGGSHYLPWQHMHLVGGKAVWLSHPFWDIRVLVVLAILYWISLQFCYYSLRRDLCNREVADHFRGGLAGWVGRDIGDDPEAERVRCTKWAGRLAPVVGLVFTVNLSLIGIDLIMALEPDWFSTMFGAWYAGGHVFVGLALLAIATVFLRQQPMGAYFSRMRQRDLATLLFAFVLLDMDFFWSQYLTIWYGNLPEETGYLIERAINTRLPWFKLSWISVFGFFFLPFFFLLFRRVKRERPLLFTISLIVVIGIFLARYIEIAPPLLHLAEGAPLSHALIPLAASALLFVGFLGTGLWLAASLLTRVPAVTLSTVEEDK